MTVEIDTYLRHKETNMDNQLEQYYLDKNNFTDEQIEEEREKKYWYYRGKLNDFRTLFEKEIDDVQFEVMFEKLMKGFLHYRILDMVNTKRYVQDVWKPYVDKEGNIKDEHIDFSSETYCSSSLTHDENEYETDTENID